MEPYSAETLPPVYPVYPSQHSAVWELYDSQYGLVMPIYRDKTVKTSDHEMEISFGSKTISHADKFLARECLCQNYLESAVTV
jgi:hypothetical protein